jgi:tetratricopeptide (TPR) repeat protein
MTAAITMERCPTEESLAAFIDGRLDENSRQHMLKHIAECGDCRDIVLIAQDYALDEMPHAVSPHAVPPLAQDSVEEPLRTVARPRFRRVIAPLAAAAAIMGMFVAIPSLRERVFGSGDPMAPLVDATQGAELRALDGRLSAAFPYKAPPPRTRGDDQTVQSQQNVLEQAVKAAERVEKNRTPENLHVYGVALLLTGNPTFRPTAVEALEEAARTEPSAELLTDLAAAYLARHADGDHQRAYAAADRAFQLKRTPNAAWNRALALQSLDRHQEAIAAWNDYGELDPNSPWADEARTKHLKNLER